VKNPNEINYSFFLKRRKKVIYSPPFDVDEIEVFADVGFTTI